MKKYLIAAAIACAVAAPAMADDVGVRVGPVGAGVTVGEHDRDRDRDRTTVIKEHEPEIYAKTAHILCPKDYVRFRMPRTWNHRFSRCQSHARSKVSAGLTCSHKNRTNTTRVLNHPHGHCNPALLSSRNRRLQFRSADFDIPQNAAKRADFQIAAAVYRHGRMCCAALKEVVASANAMEPLSP